MIDLSKYSKLAAATPYAPLPKYIWLRYNSNILSFDNALSILKASIASLNFLFKLTSFVNKKFFATCWVIVEAPSNLLEVKIFLTFLTIALNTPFASTPGCVKKFLSSADKKA